MKKKHFIIIGIIMVFAALIYFLGSSFALIENDSRVAPNSKLTYYIDVIYDGKDSEIVTSSDTATAKVNSDYIYVEDKIPEGLTFNKFITAEDGTIGAVKRSDGSSCAGYVVGDSEGLHYDASTRLVSFKVKSLQAGCKLTVGIETTTPALGADSRKDFYNTASARENYFSLKSNTVHVWMGDEDATLYTVSYNYTGTVPEGAPPVPSNSNYINGTSVGVENNSSLAGYTFSGWTTEDVTVTNGSFIMPASNVVFTGSFTKKDDYEVSYSVTGPKPEGYMVPTTKSYSEGDDVVIDTLKEGDIVSGYRFLGWTTDETGVDLSEGIFVMPNKDIELVGSFEKVVYKVTYKFQGTDMPSNANSLLPEEKTYDPGAKITLEDYPEASGYKFLGWYHTDNFEMPEEDVVIYGEWMLNSGTFSPTITKELVDAKDTYHVNDVVKFKVTVTNTATHPIKDVLLQDKLEGAYFTEGNGYTVKAEQYVVIPTIASGANVEVNAEYRALNDINKNYTNTVEITGATADNNYLLDTTREYKATVNFNVSNLKLIINKVNDQNESIEGAEYTLYRNASATDEISKGLDFDLDPNKTYYLRESKAPSGYQISDEIIRITVNVNGEVTVEGYTVSTEGGVNTLTLSNDLINLLPNTGGIGTYIYIIVGLIIAIISFMGYIIYKKRKGNK